MCGITGIFAFNPIGRMHLIHLEEATMKLEKRGPDAHQTWFDDTVGLGHRRLSVIDTSVAANQPMKDESGRYTIVFNGEIYNYKSLRDSLRKEGVDFKTESDTEVLLYAYIIWGSACLEILNGFFAFAIYDSQEKSLFLARDRYGIKPLYYFLDDHKLLFGSEMKAILAFNIPKEIDKTALHLYFQLTYIPAPQTIFKGVQKLKPGEYILVKNGEADVKSYYKIPHTDIPTLTNFDTAKTELVDALRASVHRRLVADVPLGAFLSGGIDSSIIVALASEKVKDLKTYSIGFKDNEYFDETAFAKLVADKYQTDHHTFSLSNDDLLGCVNDVLDYIDEPFADSSALPVFILSQLTRKHVTVALSGDGADEVFSGYNKHTAWLLSHEKSNANAFISTLAPVWRFLPKSRYTSFTDTIRKLNKFAMLLNLKDSEKYWFLASFISDQKIQKLLNGDWQCDGDLLESFKNSVLSPIKSGHINDVLLNDSKIVLEGDMLAKVDRMSMANGLEVRVPFLDPEVVQLAFSMPGDFKISGKYRKIILREAFKDFLPPELYTRAKHGFEVPLINWFKKELKSKLDDQVFNQERIEAQGIFNWVEIKRIRQKLYSLDPGDVHIQIWSLLVFQNWYSKYFKS
ncbi:MAG: asparagine synthase (glutamine-hydrolyzing) [Cyclobacteriaceae bacterium]|jgi:asparagine synthase (glutamine-hydrolysing)